MPRFHRPALFFAALAILVTACGADEEPAPTTAPPAPATPPTEVTTTAAPTTTAPPPTASDTPATTTTTTEPPVTTTTELPVTTTTEPGPARIKVDVYDGIADGEPRVVVARGEEVELVVTSDVTDEVHVHGYDVKSDVSPDAAAVITFIADLPGIYEVEMERSGLLLFELEVR